MKGFAVTLILGIVMNLFTAIFVSRVFFDIAEKTRFIKDLKMMHILSNPNFDFIGKRAHRDLRSRWSSSPSAWSAWSSAARDCWTSISPAAFRCKALFEQPIDIAEVRDEIDNESRIAAGCDRAGRAHRERNAGQAVRDQYLESEDRRRRKDVERAVQGETGRQPARGREAGRDSGRRLPATARGRGKACRTCRCSGVRRYAPREG